MLPISDRGKGSPALVLLHMFGSAKGEWAACTDTLCATHRCVAVDLPGHGEALSLTGYTVNEMVEALADTIRILELEEFILIGHSLSGKVAMAFAAQEPQGLAGMVLVAPSPPSPEPIKDEDRRRLLAMHRDRISAADYYDRITAKPLAGFAREGAFADFILCSPVAWAAWLNEGSKEDWTRRVGIVDCPALIITGSADPSLSAPVQQQTTMMSLSRGWIETISDCGHVPTWECPARLASLIADFVEFQITFD